MIIYLLPHDSSYWALIGLFMATKPYNLLYLYDIKHSLTFCEQKLGGMMTSMHASRHAQCVMAPECSHDNKGSELCNIANKHTITLHRECSTTLN